MKTWPNITARIRLDEQPIILVSTLNYYLLETDLHPTLGELDDTLAVQASRDSAVINAPPVPVSRGPHRLEPGQIIRAKLSFLPTLPSRNTDRIQTDRSHKRTELKSNTAGHLHRANVRGSSVLPVSGGALKV